MSRRGVTLLELVVALALLSLMLGMSGVALASLRSPAGAEAVRALENARAEAIRSGRPVIVSRAPDSGHLLFLPDGRVVGRGVDLLTGTRHARR